MSMKRDPVASLRGVKTPASMTSPSEANPRDEVVGEGADSL